MTDAELRDLEAEVLREQLDALRAAKREREQRAADERLDDTLQRLGYARGLPQSRRRRP